MADEKTDITEPFLFPNAAPYAAPGDRYEYDLYWIVNQLKQALENTETLRKHAVNRDTTVDGRLDGLDDSTAKLKSCLTELAEKLKNGDFNKGDFETWADSNMPAIVQEMVRFIFFGLDDDGHFVAYVPASWDFLHFDTILDTYKGYGRLVIYY